MKQHPTLIEEPELIVEEYELHESLRITSKLNNGFSKQPNKSFYTSPSIPYNSKEAINEHLNDSLKDKEYSKNRISHIKKDKKSKKCKESVKEVKDVIMNRKKYMMLMRSG